MTTERKARYSCASFFAHCLTANPPGSGLPGQWPAMIVLAWQCRTAPATGLLAIVDLVTMRQLNLCGERLELVGQTDRA